MQILSHRGFWLEAAEKNSEAAFIRSFSCGFGLETDLRDQNGKLVIAHDLPQGECISFDRFAELYTKHASKAYPLALNIKADGLQQLLIAALEQHGIDNYFLFDMSAPDTLACLNRGLKVFTRQSEIEPEPICYTQVCGVWMDCFYREWPEATDITRHLDTGKQVCLVSPELHKRPHESFWQFLKSSGLHQRAELMLCTDFPQAAKDYFYG